MIKAIETAYKGHRFRSRLEARWAVFFDEIRLEWWYEPEGYILNAGWYLPDFFLPALQIHVEVKPTDSADITKPWEFMRCVGPILIVAGPPAESVRAFYGSSGWVDMSLGYPKKTDICKGLPPPYPKWPWNRFDAVAASRAERFS